MIPLKIQRLLLFCMNHMSTKSSQPLLWGGLLVLISVGLLSVAPAVTAQTLVFTQTSYTFALGIRDSEVSTAVIGTVSASGGGVSPSYSISNGDVSKFSIDSSSGVLVYVGGIIEDLSLIPAYAATIRATASGQNITAMVTVNIGICDRTSQVRTAIMALIGATDCETVTTANLTAASGDIDVSSQTITSLISVDFADLSGLTSLDVRDNQLSNLPDGVFADLSSLNELYLRENNLNSLPVDVFNSLGNLEVLYLNENGLNSLSAGVFDSLGNLRILSLRENNLSSLPLDVFDALGSLNELYLSNNDLISVSAGVFDSLDRLEILSLINNELNTLPDNVFAGLTSLTSLNLNGNLVSFPVGLSLEQLGDSEFRVRSDFAGPAYSAVVWQASGDNVTAASGSVMIAAGTIASMSFSLPAAGYTTIVLTASTLVANFDGFTTNLALAQAINVAPVFVGAPYTFYFDENNNGSTDAFVIGTISATDDGGTIPIYTLVSGNTALFTLDAASGVVSYIGTGEDYEGATPTYTLNVRASDPDPPNSFIETFIVAVIRNVHECINTPATGTNCLCNRTPAVRDAIFEAITGAPLTCEGVTITHLTTVTKLELPNASAENTILTRLQPGDLDDLNELVVLLITDDGVARSNLTAIPDGIFSGLEALEYLDLSGNAITEAGIGQAALTFHSNATLRYLDLSDNQFSGLPSGVFDNLNSLQRLNIQDTPLTGLPSNVFDSLTSLQDLILDENQLAAVSADQFDNLGELQLLSLYRNNIPVDSNETPASAIPAGTFHGLTSLRFLYIDGNPSGSSDNFSNFTYNLEQISTTDYRVRSSHGAPRIEIPWTAYGGLDSSGSMFDADTVVVLPGAEGVNFSIDRSTIPEAQAITVELGSPVYDPEENELEPTEYDFPATGTTLETIDRTGYLDLAGSTHYVDYGTNLIAGAPLTTSEPGFVAANYTFTLSTVEIQSPSVVIGTVEATDADGDAVSYLITTGDPTTRFSMGASSGVLRYIGSREEAEATLNYTLSVSASDGKGLTTPTVSVMVTFINILDEVPVFAPAAYTVSLNENESGTPTAIAIVTVSATTELGTAAQYSLSNADLTRFSIGTTSGVLSYIGSGEDFESIISGYTLTVQAADGASSALFATAAVTVTIVNTLDTAPVFDSAAYTVSLNENESGTPTAIAIVTVSATTELGTAAQYSLSNADLTRFRINSDGVVSYIGSGEDFEGIISGYTLTVQATDPASSALFATAAVTVTIANTLDTAPVFDPAAYTVSLNENESGAPTAIAIGTVSATTELGTAVQYSLSNADLTRFRINSDGVVSYIGSGEDFEGIISGYTLTVQATDPASSALFATAAVTVTIANTLDTAPVFDPAAYSVSLNENESGTPTAIAIGTVSATTELGTAVQYSLSTADPTRFSLHTTDGVLSYIGSGEDFESIESYTLTVTATDTASPALTAAATIVVAIGDVDDAPNTAPVFIGTPYSFDLDENQPGPVLLGSVSATDNASTVSYALRDDYPTRFSLHTTSGALSYIGSGEDFESIESYTLTVTASDTASPALTAAATIVVAIGDVDDAPNTAPVFVGAPYSFDLDENQPGPVLLGSVIATDNASTVSYALLDDTPARFSLAPISGALSYIGSGEDFESIESYTLTVTATDTASPALTAAATIVVAIGDVDDAPNTAPVFVGAPYSFDLDENQPGPVLLGSVTATDNASSVSYMLRDDYSARFSLHTTSGALSYIGTGEDVESTPAYTLTVMASDSASPALSASAAIVVEIGEVVDNTAPVFIGTPYSFDLDENQAGPVLLGTVTATDNASSVSYMLRDDYSARFSLHTISGALTYIGSGEDFDSTPAYTLTVMASDAASPALSATAAIVIAIGEVVDNTAPVFIGTPYSFDLNENQPGTVLLGSVSATDNASTVSYALRDDYPTRFSLHTTSGALSYIGSGEDFESIESYTLTVTASDTASPALTAAATIVVAIGDVDDAPNTAPVFIGTPYSFDLDENQPGPVRLGTVSATDNASSVSYALRDDYPTRFSLHTTSGALSYIGSGEDFESIESYTLTVTASDTASPALTAAATIVVAIGDVDDAPNTAPVFIGTPYSFDLNENQPGPVRLGTVSATDNASTVSYALRDDYPTRFSLHTTSGALSYIGSGEDFESIESYTLTVTASDTASPALTAATTIVVAIGDVDDAPNTAPVFVGAPYSFDLDENQPGPVRLGSVSATDNASTVSYALRDDYPTRFSLHTISGALSYIGTGEDFESIESYTLTVTASDTASPALTAAATIVVAIGDVDDAPNTAPVFIGTPYSFDLNENQPGPVLLGTVSATDNASTVSYALRDDYPTRFSLHTTSGALSYIGSGEDFESIESYTLTVTASDTASPALTAAATIVVAIGDVDDAPNTAPVFIGTPYTFDLDENRPGPVLLGSVTATDNASTVSYALFDDYPTRFSLHTTSGALSYIGSGEDFDSTPAYTLTVMASDAASPALSASAAIVIAIGEVVDNTAPVFIGTPYSFDLDENQAGPVLLGSVAATDNASTVSYALLDDTPARFSLDTTSGALSYIGSGEDFESIESYTLTVTASDTASPALTAAATIVVAIGDVDDAPNTAPVFIGTPYSFDLDENQPGPVRLGSVSATDNASTVSYALLDDTPARFSLDTTSGALSYIGSGEDFESIESYTLTVTASDTASPALTAAATIVVAIGDVDDAPNTAPVFIGTPYSFDLNENQPGPVRLGTVSATDNASTVSYALLDDTPARFSLDTISGALSYIGSGEDVDSTPAYTLTVMASDAASPALSATAAIVVAVIEAVDAPNTAPVFIGTPYSFDLDENQAGPVLLGTVTATDNASSVSYALRDDYPARFSLDTISGALSYIGSGEDFENIESYTLTVTATDGASSALFATAAVTVTIVNTLDTAPVFDPAAYIVSLNENESGTPTAIAIVTVSATTELGTAVQYSLSNADPTRFSIHTTSGALSYIGSGEDIDSTPAYTLTVMASDAASPALSATAAIVVEIGDVDDALNTAPVFIGTPYSFDLNENQPGPVLLGSVSATDNASTVSYALRDDYPTRFSLHTTSGALSYIGSGEDFESIESYTLTVTATDTASPALTAAATIVVAIGDVDDAPNTAPVFVGAPYSFDLDENQTGPVLLGSVSATDNASTVSYALLDDTPARFSLAPISGALSYIGSGEDFESIESYTLTVTATDTASPALTAAATIVVAIGDVDEAPNTAPVFVGAPYTFDLDENQPGPVLLGTVSATDNASTVSYALRDDSPARFSLAPISGALSYIGSGEDFESIESYTLTVTATDTASPALTAAATIVVAIGDVDEALNTAPVFIGTPYSFDLDENQAGPVLLGTVTATDNASSVSYALRDDYPARFSLHTISGALSYIGSGEDFESIESYTLTVTATDTASPALTAAATIVVAIGDVDDAPNTAPVFVGAPYSFDLDENRPGPVLLGSVSATDNASTVSYALRDDSPARFSLAPISGALSYIGTGEDFEGIISGYTLTVTATDTASPALTAATTIVVAIGDVDDAPNTAPVFVGAPYSFDLDENRPGPVLLGSVTATDNASSVSYMLRDDYSARFSLHTISGALSYIGSGEDFESIESYTLTVTATDTASPALTAATTIVVAIGDVDDAPNTAPVFVGAPYSFDLDENQPGPVLLGSVSATDNASSVSYALFDDYSARFSLHTTSGALSYIGSGEDFDSTPAYTLTVMASDSASPALSASAAIVIAIGEVVDNTAPVFIGTPYSFDLDENQAGPVLLGSVAATDNASSVSYALRDDTPARFSLDTISGALSYIGSGEDFEGIISGYTLTVTATDGASSALFATAAVTVTIVNTLDTAPVFDPAAYTVSLNENESGTPTAIAIVTVSATTELGTAVQYSLSNADPTRFSLHTTDGVLSYIGTGEDFEGIISGYTLTVQATDGASSALFATAAVTVTITNTLDTAPVFAPAAYTVSLNENESGAPTAIAIVTVSATTELGTAVQYSLSTADPTRFSLHTTSGALSYIGSGEDFESIESYTLTVTASDTASPALTAAATIVVAIGDVDDAPNTAPAVEIRTEMTKTVLAQVGQNIAIDTVDVLGGRFGAAPHVTVSGNALNAKQWSRLSHWMQLDNWQSESAWNGVEREVELDLLEQWGQRWDLFRDQLLSGSSFLIPLGAAGDDDGNSGGRLEDWSIWGQGRISGYQHTDAGLKVSGQSLSGYLGVDYRASERLLIGVAVSRSDSDGYSEMAADGSNHTDIDTELTSVFPYVHWNPSAGLELWGAVGHGQGEVEVKPQEQAMIVADIEIAAAAFGVKRALVSVGDTDIAVKADGFVVKIESDGVVGLNATEAESHRLRVALSGSRDWLLSGNARTFSGMELGLRADGGDTLQGRGLDIGANLGYINPDIGLELSSRLRLLLAYSQNYNEWGLDLTMRLRPGQLGRGLSLALSPGWGQAKAEIDTLWEDGGSVLKPRLSHGSGVIPDRTKLSLSYGLQYKSVLLEPFAQMGVSRDQLSNLKLGVRGSLPWLRVEVSGNNAHQIGVVGVLGF